MSNLQYLFNVIGFITLPCITLFGSLRGHIQIYRSEINKTVEVLPEGITFLSNIKRNFYKYFIFLFISI